MERGLLLGGCGTHAIRLRPSLLFEKRHADEFLTLFEETLSSVWIHYFTNNIIFEITHTPTTRLITVFPNVTHTGPNATDDATLFTILFCSYTYTLFPFIKILKMKIIFISIMYSRFRFRQDSWHHPDPRVPEISGQVWTQAWLSQKSSFLKFS